MYDWMRNSDLGLLRIQSDFKPRPAEQLSARTFSGNCAASCSSINNRQNGDTVML